MSRLFISHSSANNAEAVAIRDWLVDAGWNEVFLDLDPDRGITAGERWERALNEAASRCEAVLFLISQDWLNSRWCLKEFNLARRLNKRLFGVLIDAIPVGELPAGFDRRLAGRRSCLGAGPHDVPRDPAADARGSARRILQGGSGAAAERAGQGRARPALFCLAAGATIRIGRPTAASSRWKPRTPASSSVATPRP